MFLGKISKFNKLLSRVIKKIKRGQINKYRNERTDYNRYHRNRKRV